MGARSLLGWIRFGDLTLQRVWRLRQSLDNQPLGKVSTVLVALKKKNRFGAKPSVLKRHCMRTYLGSSHAPCCAGDDGAFYLEDDSYENTFRRVIKLTTAMKATELGSALAS